MAPPKQQCCQGLAQSCAHLCYNPTLGQIFFLQRLVSRELSDCMNKVTADSMGYFKAWSQSIFLTGQAESMCQGLSPVCSNFSPHICRSRTKDLCYIIIITPNIHPNLQFIFCAWKQSLYLTIIPTHKTIHSYNLYGHKTLMIFCRPSKCF